MDAAVKLVPKFTEHDIETFLLSFEKVAELNSFPHDKYAAVLQAHLTGKALKVFTELSVEKCKNCPTLKAALLQAYSVVLEVYRKRFHNLTESHSETYSEFAFRLGTQFNRWLESEGANSDINLLRDLLQREQFQTILDSQLRVWLIDQKPKSLLEAARLADQYVAVRKAERPGVRGRDSKSKSYVQVNHGSSGVCEHKSFPSSASDKASAGHKFSDAATVTKGDTSGSDRSRVVCYYCKKPGHIMSNCAKRRAKTQQNASENVSVQLVSTLSSAISSEQVSQKPPDVDPRFEEHCLLVTVIRPDQSRHIVKALRDTGALQSLVSSQFLTDSDYESIGEYRMIRGVTGEIVPVPLVSVVLQSTLCSGKFLYGLVPSLPSGISMLIGKDLCPSMAAVDVAVVIRSQSTAVHRDAKLSDVQELNPNLSPVSTESDQVDKSANNDLSSLFESDDASKTIPFELVNRSELIRLQQSDPGLSSLFEQAKQGDNISSEMVFLDLGVLS